MLNKLIEIKESLKKVHLDLPEVELKCDEIVDELDQISDLSQRLKSGIESARSDSHL